MRWLILVGFLCLVFAGCGGAAGYAPVSGKVTMDGAPLEGASVSFEPTGKAAGLGGSYGRTDAEGKYALKRTTDDAQGAAVGDHTVTISKNRNAADDAVPPEEFVPAKYRDGSLKFSVPSGGTDKADFVLTSK